MEKLDLNYIEDVITYSAIIGSDREIICPSIIEYVSEDTFQKEGNLLILNIVKNFYLEEARIPHISEISTFVIGEPQRELFKLFLKMCKSFEKNLKYDKILLIKHIEEFLKQRIMLGVLKEAHIKEVAGTPLETAEISTRIEEAMSIYLMDDIGLNLFEDNEEYLEKLVSEDTKISSGYKWLDEQLGGGFLSGGCVMYNFLATSNIGKSNFIKSLAGNIVKQNKNVLVVSLEMPRYIYANRFVSELSGYPIHNLKGHIEGVGDFLSSAYSNGFGTLLIKDFATGSITPQALLSYIRRAQKTLGIKFDAIFIDYPELLKPSRTYSGRHDLTVSHQYIETRAISFVLEAPIISVAQLNRSAYNSKTPTMENCGNGIGIIQCSDFAGFLYADDEMKKINIMGLTIGKSRFGPVNKSYNYNVSPDTLAITEVSQDYSESPMEINVETNYIENEDASDVLDDLFAS